MEERKKMTENPKNALITRFFKKKFDPAASGSERSECSQSGSDSQTKQTLKRRRKTSSSKGTPNKRSKKDDSEDVYDKEAELLEDETPHGLKRSLHGAIYQLQLLVLFAYRGLQKVNKGEYEDFFLGTEIEKAKKFDDVVFGYKLQMNEDDKNKIKEKIDNSNDKGEDNITWLYLQAKHKQDPDSNDSIITKTNLLTGKDKKDQSFKLLKYLSAFCKIEDLQKKDDRAISIDTKPYECHIKKEPEEKEESDTGEEKVQPEAQPPNLPGPSSESFIPEKKESNSKLYILCTNTYFNNNVEDWLVKNKLSKEDLLYFNDLEKSGTEEVRFNIKIVLPKLLKNLVDNCRNSEIMTIQNEVLKDCEREIEKIRCRLQFRNNGEEAKRRASSLLRLKIKGNKVQGKTIIKELDELLTLMGNILKAKDFEENSKAEDSEAENSKTEATDYQTLKDAYEKLKEAKKNLEDKVKAKGPNSLPVIKQNVGQCAENIEKTLNNYLQKSMDITGLPSELQTKVQSQLEEMKNQQLQNILDKLISTDLHISKEIQDEIRKEIQNEIAKRIIPEEILKDTEKILENPNTEDAKKKVILISKEFKNAVSKISNLQNNLKNIGACENFLQNFRFIVKYPNVDELNEFINRWLTDESIISEESKKNLKLLNVDLAANTFEKDILKWFKEKNSRFLRKEGVKRFIESILQQIKGIMVQGMSNTYPEKLKSYKISFTHKNKLEDFLSSADKNIIHIETQATRLSAIKLLQCLKKDTYIFLRLRTLLRSDLQDLIVDTFLNEYSSLVIDCQKNEEHNKTGNKKIDVDSLKEKVKKQWEEKWGQPWEQLRNKLQGNEKFKSKRIILIAEKEDIFVQKIKEEHSICTFADKNEFKNLDEESQIRLLQKRIDFQSFNTKINESGKELPLTLNDVLNKETGEKIIDEEILSELIEMEEEIKIGDERSFTPVPDYYIDRTLKKLGKKRSNDKDVNQEGEDSNQEEDSNYKEEYLSTLNPNLKIVIVANDSGVGKSTYSASMIKKIKKKNPDVWAVKLNLNDHAEEKSTKSLDIVEDKDGPIRFLIKAVVLGPRNIPMNKFQQDLFKETLLTERQEKKIKIIIFLDAFDETSPGYTSKITKLIEFLIESKVTQIWITTRRHKLTYLQENFLNTTNIANFTFLLQPLNLEQQISFLEQYWKWKLKFSKITDFRKAKKAIISYKKELEKVNENDYFKDVRQEIQQSVEENKYALYIAPLREALENLNFSEPAKKLLEKWENFKANDRIELFPICPLSLEIVGSLIFDNHFKQITEFGLLQLYEKYEEKKFDIFFKEKAKTKPGNQPANFLNAISSGALKRVFQELAVKSLFPEEKQLPNLNEMEKLEKDLLSKNITGIKEELARIGFTAIDLRFGHRSFAEYFASQYINRNCVKNTKVQLFSKKIVNLEDYKLIKIFLSSFLRKKPPGNDPHKRKKQTIKMILEGSDNIQDTANYTLNPTS